MKTEQFIDIKTKLAKWREERGLSVEVQKKNFEVNYTKELLEYFEAKRDNNEYEMIDALCDMIVVCVNAGGNIGCASCEFTNINLTYPIIYRSIDIKGLLYELRREGYDPYKCLLETIKELNSRTGSWNKQEGKWVKDKGTYTEEEALQNFLFGIRDDDFEVRTEEDFFIVADTRRGEEYRVKKWYKADYESCKLESVE